MRIAQIILPDAPEYERKLQRVDFAALSDKHEVIVGDVRGADITHVYARVAYVSSGRKPKVVLTEVPEAVEDTYFGNAPHPAFGHPLPAKRGEGRVIGAFARKSIRNIVGQTHHRLSRTRDDVEWHLFERVPAPEDLAAVDVWVDPAIDEKDFDGFVAEALVVGLPVVASRTKMNAARLEHGRTGFLVPLNDANEMTHAILAALFKPEVAGAKQNAARQTMSKFRARQRLRVLAQTYESLLT